VQLRRIFLAFGRFCRGVLVALSLRMQLRLVAAQCGIHLCRGMLVALSVRMKLRLVTGPCRQARAGVHAGQYVLGRSMHACRFFPRAYVLLML